MASTSSNQRKRQKIEEPDELHSLIHRISFLYHLGTVIEDFAKNCLHLNLSDDVDRDKDVLREAFKKLFYKPPKDLIPLSTAIKFDLLSIPEFRCIKEIIDQFVNIYVLLCKFKKTSSIKDLMLKKDIVALRSLLDGAPVERNYDKALLKILCSHVANIQL